MFAFFEKLVTPFPPEEPKQPPGSLLAFCYHYTKGVQFYLLLMAVLTVLVAVMEVALFAFLGELVDWLNHKAPETLLQDEGTVLLGMSAMVLLGLPIASFLHSLVVHQTLLGNYPMIIRWQAHRFLLGQSLAFYQDEFAGRVATKLMQTALAVREAVMKLLDVLLYVAVYFGGVALVAASSDYRLLGPLLIWLLFYIIVMIYFIPRLNKIAEKQADARSDMTGRIVDTYTNIMTVKLFSHSQRESDYARQGMQSFLNTVYPQMRMVTQLNMCVWLLNALLIFSISALSVYLWMQSAISTGMIAASVGLVLRLNAMSQWVMWELSSLFENFGTVQDGIGMLSKPHTVVDGDMAEPLAINAGGIVYENVAFHYGKGSGVIGDFSLVIKPGEKIGLVGRSGAGKSTLVNLLLRFYDVEKGTISIDGQNVAEVQQESLREQIAMVTQDTSLLHRSIRDNIIYGKPGVTEQAMQEAAKRAKAHTFIQGLDDGIGNTAYDALVGERGVKLSGGQRQRIAIARVLLKNAPILILDEATSALDSEIESAIQESLYDLMHGKTVIAIAHRLSTIAALDRLIVLDQGRIIEQGSHQDLLAQGGLYAQLWAHQSGGFLGES